MYRSIESKDKEQLWLNNTQAFGRKRIFLKKSHKELKFWLKVKSYRIGVILIAINYYLNFNLLVKCKRT